MAVKIPSLKELERIAGEFKLHPNLEDLEFFRATMADTFRSYDRLDQLAEPALPVNHPRGIGYRPAAAENPLNAWYWRCEIKGAPEGLLGGKTFAIKDNVCVAGIPMMNGTSVLEGFVPAVDATVVTRILDAGGTILGKSVCESLCFSGGSHTADTGPVLNPHDHRRTTGGSSSGSAALVATGAVNMAIGGDQGGSIRMPSGWCGIYGLKPTWGLVPYTGAFPIEMTLDHLGPIARSAADAALLLEVIAGPDGFDPRQNAAFPGQAYSKALTGDIRGLRIGVVKEGFGWEGESEQDVDEIVKQTAHGLEKIGAVVTEVSIPWHRDGRHVWSAIALEGATMFMVAGNSMGTNWKGYYTTGLLDAFARARLTRADDLSETTKLVMLIGGYMQDRYHGRYYAKAQNLAHDLRAAYDKALGEHDLLVMPTVPMKATLFPTPGDKAEYIARALGMIANTCPFNVTGHPAMSVPCVKSQGLPVAMMLIGRHGDDATVLRAADAYQRNLAER